MCFVVVLLCMLVCMFVNCVILCYVLLWFPLWVLNYCSYPPKTSPLPRPSDSDELCIGINCKTRPTAPVVHPRKEHILSTQNSILMPYWTYAHLTSFKFFTRTSSYCGHFKKGLTAAYPIAWGCLQVKIGSANSQCTDSHCKLHT